MGYSFDGTTKIITLTSGTTSLNVQDLYSRWKDWVELSDNSKFAAAFSVVGGDPVDIAAGIYVTTYYFLDNGWKVRPQEANHKLRVFGGVLVTVDGTDPFIQTVGSYNVMVQYSQPVKAETVATGGGGGGGATPAQIAEAVWDDAQAGVVITAAVPSTAQIAAAVPTLSQIIDGVPSVAEIVDGVPSVAEIAAAVPTLSQIVDAVPTLSEIVDGVPNTAEIAAAVPTLAQIVDAVPNTTEIAAALPSAAQIADAVWDEAYAAHNIAGTYGLLAQQIATDADQAHILALQAVSLMEVLLKYEKNRTKIDKNAFTLTVYDDNGVTPIRVFNLKNSLGAPSVTEVTERVPV